MPLYKRKPFTLLEPPKDLKPKEDVYQVRFTKEIFKDYQAYLKRLNLYRQRVWTCKVTGKTNLTYEEALVSEHNAAEKVKAIPNELIASILQSVQYSTLRLDDLANAILNKLQGNFFEGLVLLGKKDNSICPCKILKVVEGSENVLYEIGWLDYKKKVSGTSMVDADSLIYKRFPLSRNMLKSFIRESTIRKAPWVVHEKLATKHGLQMTPPEGLKLVLNKNGYPQIEMNGNDGMACDGKNEKKKRKRVKDENIGHLNGESKVTKDENSGDQQGKKKKEKKEDNQIEVPIRYPIDDLLVKPGVDDPVFTSRPIPYRDFRVPMDCVGDLIMTWDFCSSFSRMLKLWPFSMEDLENALCHKETTLVLIVESHSALLNLLMKDEGDFSAALKKGRSKAKLSVVNWTEYLCEYLEMHKNEKIQNKTEISAYMSTIKRGHYGVLDVHAKLGIFCLLVADVLNTDAIRSQLEEYIAQQQALAAAKREETRKIREEQQLAKESRSSDNNAGKDLNDDGSKNQSNRTSLTEKENGDHKFEDSALEPSKNLKTNGFVELEEAPRTEESKRKKKGQKEKELEDKEKKIKEKFQRDTERKYIRTHPLGKDRNYNRYWFFRNDGRIFVESLDSKDWSYYSTKEELDALIGSLNPKGERERALKMQLERHYSRISVALQKRTKDMAHRILREEAVLRRSTRVQAQPRDSEATAYLRYTNKWKED